MSSIQNIPISKFWKFYKNCSSSSGNLHALKCVKKEKNLNVIMLRVTNRSSVDFVIIMYNPEEFWTPKTIKVTKIFISHLISIVSTKESKTHKNNFLSSLIIWLKHDKKKTPRSPILHIYIFSYLIANV